MENVDKHSTRRVWITSDERKYGGHIRKLDAEKAQHEGDYVWMYACTYTYTYTYPSTCIVLAISPTAIAAKLKEDIPLSEAAVHVEA